MSSKSVLTIFSYTVLKLARFLSHNVYLHLAIISWLAHFKSICNVDEDDDDDDDCLLYSFQNIFRCEMAILITNLYFSVSESDRTILY